MAAKHSGGYSIKIRRRKKKKKSIKTEQRKINRGLVFLLAAVAALAIASRHLPQLAETVSLTQKGAQASASHEPTYLNGVTIDGISVGGLNYEQAKMLIENSVNTDLVGNALVVKSTDGSKSYTYTYDSFGISFNVEAALKDALEFCTVEEEYAADIKALQNGMADFSVYSYSRPKIASCIRAIGAANTSEARNASCEMTANGFEVTPEQTGYSVDTAAIYKKAIDLIDARSFNKEIEFEIKVIQPSVTAADFAYVENELSSFSSEYSGGDENRIQNLRNACSKINGTIIYPDKVFSTNDAFNPCTEANGWANAATIVGGKLEDSIGGGMCQVSSALYDAALYAELDIVERHNHSMKVGYAKYAFDATLAGDYLDLKIRNNTGYPIYIESYLTSSRVVVKIYGYNRFPASHRVELENKFIEEIPHGDYVVIDDPELPKGEEHIEVTQLNGQKYELYKYVYENGELIDTVKINTSTYRPRDGEKHIGTKETGQGSSDDDEDNDDNDDNDVVMDEIVYDEDND